MCLKGHPYRHVSLGIFILSRFSALVVSSLFLFCRPESLILVFLDLSLTLSHWILEDHYIYYIAIYRDYKYFLFSRNLWESL